MNTESSESGKDPMMMYSDIPVNRYDYLRKLSDEELNAAIREVSRPRC